MGRYLPIISTAMAEREANQKRLWIGAAVTTFTVGFFPRLNAVLAEDVPIWHLDPEARILLPVILVLSVLLFVVVGKRAWRHETDNRPAKVGLICGVLSLVGGVAFFLSLPIMLGGLAATLGIEGRNRAPSEGRGGQANAATALGVLGFVAGAAIWVLAGEL